MTKRENQLYWKVVEPILDKVSIYDGVDNFLNEFGNLPPVVGDLYAADRLVYEVNNGALPQFFSNSTGVLGPEAVSALRRMGLVDAADIVASAMLFFGEEYPRDRGVRSELIDWVWEKNLSEDELHNLDTLLELSGQFLDAMGKKKAIFYAAANAYAYANECLKST